MTIPEDEKRFQEKYGLDWNSLYKHEQFVVATGFYRNMGLIFDNWVKYEGYGIVCGMCHSELANNQKEFRYREIKSATPEEILKVKGFSCVICGTFNEHFFQISERERYKIAELKSLEDSKRAAEIARLETLARNGDLIAFHEWKRLTGN